jgi:hypothetical protein
MAYDMTGKEVHAKRRCELVEVENKDPKFNAALKYNHVRIQFPDGCERSLLFTDKEVERAIYTACQNEEDLPIGGWLRESLLSLINYSIADLQKVANTDKEPAAAKKYNHIVIVIKETPINLLFTDNVLVKALKRAENNPEDLPEVSWLMDALD